MSEVLRTSEKQPSPELGENQRDLLAEKKAAAENAEKLDANEARSAVEKASPISKEAGANKLEENSGQPSDISWWSKELGSQSLERSLNAVRRHLTKPQRRLSKVIHQPAIEKVSDLGAKTIARPSGILVGGIFSFIASLGAYILARRLGGELHYSIFIVTFVLGYAVGLVVEMVWFVLSKAKR